MVRTDRRFVVLIFVLFTTAYAQESRHTHFFSFSGFKTDTLLLNKTDSLYSLSTEYVFEQSVSAWLDSISIESRFTEYSLKYGKGLLFISKSVLSSLLIEDQTRKLIVTYRPLPLAFKKEYSLRKLTVKQDSVGKKEYSITKTTSTPIFQDVFGPGIQKSGTLVRGFTIGTNRDMTLNSGLRMSLSGKISEDVDVVAVLTDENSPIQPEGTTQTLQEIDKVFVEIRSSNWNATLGDFYFEVGSIEGGEFGRVNRKLQGARGILNFPEMTQNLGGILSVTGATSRGKYHSNQFQGIEGSQGPYRLTGINGEQRILVIAGTERVYLNGELMTRGEVNDFTIEYGTGEIFFTSKRLITSASRITVDFEYADRQFTRNLLGATAQTKLFEGKGKLNTSFIQEADDPDSPIDFTIDDATKKRIAEAGIDRFAASVWGVRYAGIDSLTGFGKGQYRLKDTIINSKKREIYIYAPGSVEAYYSVSFSYLDRVPLDSCGYRRIGAGRFEFAGIGQGNYLPIVFLPVPQLQRFFDINGEVNVMDNLVFIGEYAGSYFDQNRFSGSQQRLNSGGALKLGFKYTSNKVKLFDKEIGKIEFNGYERYRDKKFVTPDRANEVEFNRNWNIENMQKSDEEIRELQLKYSPLKSLNLSTSYGSLDRKDQYLSKRLRADANFLDSTTTRVDYALENIETHNIVVKENSDWIRQRGSASYLYQSIQPEFRVETEQRKTTLDGSDSALTGSFRFLELAPKISVFDFSRMDISAEAQFRGEDSVINGNLTRTFNSLTQIYNASLREWNSFAAIFTLNFRQVDFTEQFKKRGNSNSDVLIVRSQVRYGPLQRAIESEGFYEFTTQRSAKYERLFIRVQRGTGNYRYLGDLNGNGITEENEFELTRFDGDYIALMVAGDQLLPVVDLKSSLRLRLQPKRLLPVVGSNIENILSALSTETIVRIEEKSTETDTRQIYFLNLSKFQNPSTTISGSSYFSQDIHFFENAPDLSFRLRFAERKSYVQLVSGGERGYMRERSLRVRSQLVEEIYNQTEITNKQDNVEAPSFSMRARNLVSNSINSDFSYRPDYEWEGGFVLEVGRTEDFSRLSVPTANVNSQTFRLTYSIPLYGQFRAQVSREEVRVVNATIDPLKPFVYEFTAGKTVGKSFLWQINLDYRIGQNVQLSLYYNGRTEGGREPIHLARMEARAFF